MNLPFLFGKAPAEPDFLRINIQSTSALDVADWITRAVEMLALNNASLPSAVTRMIYCASPDVAYVGAFAPSRDAVGRAFPICVMTPVAIEVAASCYPALPLAFEPFLKAVTALIHEVPVLDRDAIVAGVHALRAPTRESIYAAMDEVTAALHEESAGGLVARVFGDDESAACYGLQTFVTAAAPLRQTGPSRSPTVLDCPMSIDMDLLTWLSLAKGVTGWTHTVPSACWLSLGEARLLLSLGAPNGQLLQFLSDPACSSSRLWPLRTDRAAARDSAVTELATVIGSFSELSLHALIASLSNERAQ